MHGLEQHTQADGTIETSFVSARVDGWHRLGTVTDDCFDAETAMKKAHLANWNVRKEPIQTVSGLIVPGQYAPIRDNPFTGLPEVIGSSVGKGSAVGEIWTPIQNEDHIGFLDALTDESGAVHETAGALHGGRDVFVTMKLPETMQVGGLDPIGLYIAALNNHVGTAAYQFLVTPVRIVCANTQAAAIRGAKRKFSIRHTSGAAKQIQVAREALGLTWKYLEGFQTEADKLVDQAYTDAEFAKLVEQLVPDPETDSKRALTSVNDKREGLLYSWSDSPTNKDIRNTRWGAYQAVTEWADHLFPVRGDDPGTLRALRTLEGRADDVKLAAWDALVGAN